MNNAPFHIGQKVEFIDVLEGHYEFDDISPKLKKGDIVIVIDIILSKGYNISNKKEWYIEPDTHKGYLYAANDFRPIEENTYEDVTKQLAVLPQDEVPDVKHIKELV